MDKVSPKISDIIPIKNIIIANRLLKLALSILRNNPVLSISILAAVVTGFFVPPDMKYLEYFDYKTLTCLFCMLAVICAFKNILFFEILSRRIIMHFRTTRSIILALVYITFVGSMLITNDMALITFLPLSYFVLNAANQKKYIAFTFVMQSIAANLGGMLTPFGNPQNLYLYTYFNIPYFEFLRIMFPPFIISALLITVCCMFVKRNIIQPEEGFDIALDKKKAGIYVLLFLFSAALVFRGIPFWLGLAVIPAILFFIDRKALRNVDYPLLLTFCAFFVFSGNASRIHIISEFFGTVLEKSVLLTGIIASQFISNVPSAVLLSQYTENYPALLVAVNVGGVGTLIASLASLITFNAYRAYHPGKQWHFIALFSVLNFAFLIALTAFSLF